MEEKDLRQAMLAEFKCHCSDFFYCHLVDVVVPFSKKIQRVTIQGAFGW